VVRTGKASHFLVLQQGHAAPRPLRQGKFARLQGLQASVIDMARGSATECVMPQQYQGEAGARMQHEHSMLRTQESAACAWEADHHHARQIIRSCAPSSLTSYYCSRCM